MNFDEWKYLVDKGLAVFWSCSLAADYDEVTDLLNLH
jgi:hypothetical protein